MEPRTIVRVDGFVRIIRPWDFPTNVQPPYLEYAVTVLHPENLPEYWLIALEHKINWYGFEKPPTPQGDLDWL